MTRGRARRTRLLRRSRDLQSTRHDPGDPTAFAAALGLGGLAFSLAARDTVADAIAGFIILVDQPFRIGDRIEIREVGTWGDVTDIGLRTTRIRTRDNRMVIVPNSIIGANQVINYSYPDPRVRNETDLCVGYDSDLEEVRRLIIETIQGIEGVLDYRNVDALYIEMAPSGIVFRVRWWIESYQDTRRNLDQVHTALQRAFDQAPATLTGLRGISGGRRFDFPKILAFFTHSC